MRKSWATLTAIVVSACFIIAGASSLYSQTFNNPVTILYLTSSTGQPIGVSPQNPLPVTASVSVGSFLPSLSYNTCTATGSSCASTALPTNTGSVVLFNSGTTTVSCTLATGAATAVASELQIQASSWLGLATTAYDHYACIDQTGSASNVVIASGGTGLPAGAGGGGGGGGGGAITAASGSYASGALSSGSMVDLGAQADAAAAADNSTASLIALLKRNNQNLTTLNTTAGSSIPAGTNLIGKFGFDQTTPGTTNGAAIAGVNAATALAGSGATGTGSLRVTTAIDQATNAGAALVKGGVGVVNGGSFYQAVAASQTATVLQSSTGATGDYLSHCVIYPTSTTPGVVTVFDNTNTAATSAILFPGGASSVSNLAPIAVPVGAVSTAGAWKVTTGANVSVVCYGKFS